MKPLIHPPLPPALLFCSLLFLVFFLAPVAALSGQQNGQQKQQNTATKEETPAAKANPAAAAFELVITVKNLKTLSGKLNFTLTDDEKFFNKNKKSSPSARVFQKSYVLSELAEQYDAENKTLTLTVALDTFFDLPPEEEERRYALTLFHDEDGDEEMDTNFIGIPKEPVGSSVNPDQKRSFGRPKFKGSSFLVKRGAANQASVELFKIFD